MRAFVESAAGCRRGIRAGRETGPATHRDGKIRSARGHSPELGTAFEIRPLSPGDVDAVAAIYAAEFDSLPVGTLNHRTREDFERILSSPGGASIGAFAEGRPVGYTLCDIGPWKAAADPFAFARLLPRGEPVGQVFGTLVYRAFKGHALGERMIRARRDALLAKGVEHATGTMLTDNFSSIITYLRCGSVLCGFETDEYGLLNFAHYSGTLADRTPAGPWIRTPDLDAMRALFARGHVCRSLEWDRTGGSRRPVWSMSGEFAGSD